jgi:hypothetical protein
VISQTDAMSNSAGNQLAALQSLGAADKSTILAVIDDAMKNYKSIHDWLIGLGFPEDNKQYTQMLEGAVIDSYESSKAFSDATLTILNNSNSAIQTIMFVDAYPESLDSITFLSTSQDVQYLVGVATFRYSYYKFA